MIKVSDLDKQLPPKEELLTFIKTAVRLSETFEFESTYDFLWFLSVHSQFRPLFKKYKEEADDNSKD